MIAADTPLRPPTTPSTLLKSGADMALKMAARNSATRKSRTMAMKIAEMTATARAIAITLKRASPRAPSDMFHDSVALRPPGGICSGRTLAAQSIAFFMRS